MVTFDSMNAHYQYMDFQRHWCPLSEPYAGGDALVTFLNDGWKIRGPVFLEQYWHAGVRMVTIFHCSIERNGTSEAMCVLSNPYVERLLNTLAVEILPISQRQQEKVEESC